MTDFPSDPESAAGEHHVDTAREEPAFGLVDVVEAFTAMRHEFRVQNRESRQLADTLQQATERFEQISKANADALASKGRDNDAIRDWVDSLIEVDLAFTRAFEALRRKDNAAGQNESAQTANDPQSGEVTGLTQEIRRDLEHPGFLGRLFCGGLIKRMSETVERHERGAEKNRRKDTTVEGLEMVLARVRQLLRDRGIERIETAGQTFDAEMMNAVEATESDQYSPGQVARELCPAYRWNDQIVRFAEVVVARPKREP